MSGAGPRAERGGAAVVPVSGSTAALTWAASAAMAFVAVFALALSLGAGRLADRWDGALSASVTLRLTAPTGALDAATDRALEVLQTTPGITGFRLIDTAEQRALLAPWFGADMPIDELPLPRLFDIAAAPDLDTGALQLRLEAVAPGAVLDDHGQWRRPMVQAAGALRAIAIVSVGLIAAAMAALIGLAAGFSLAANAQVIRVLRLIGARDGFIIRAFTRRFALRALIGAALGTLAAMAALAVLPGGAGGVLAGLGPQGADWLAMLAVPPLAAAIAWMATQAAARRVLRKEG